MAVTFTDEWGVVTDTGVGSRPTARPSIETKVEATSPTVKDTGTATTPSPRPTRRQSGQSR